MGNIFNGDLCVFYRMSELDLVRRGERMDEIGEWDTPLIFISSTIQPHF